jgi:hypothetical protein
LPTFNSNNLDGGDVTAAHHISDPRKIWQRRQRNRTSLHRRIYELRRLRSIAIFGARWLGCKRMNYAIAISFWTGLISLAQEILWVRYVSFASQGLPQSFSLVLILYLLGISVGAWIGKKACKQGDDLAMKIRTTLRIAAVAIVLTAAGKSVIFPMTHQLGSSEGSRLGRSISSVYFANVLGATFGPIFATFVLLSLLTLQQALVCLAALTMICALVLEEKFNLNKIAQAVTGLALATVLVFAEPHRMIRALVAKGSDASSPLIHIIESPHGIVHTETSQLGAGVCAQP